jgi:hypothetical protein
MTNVAELEMEVGVAGSTTQKNWPVIVAIVAIVAITNKDSAEVAQ